jgi:hypothetical protein
MQVDDARRQHLSIRVYACLGRAEIFAGSRDAAALDGDASVYGAATEAIDDPGVFNHEVVHISPLLPLLCVAHSSPLFFTEPPLVQPRLLDLHASIHLAGLLKSSGFPITQKN